MKWYKYRGMSLFWRTKELFYCSVKELIILLNAYGSDTEGFGSKDTIERSSGWIQDYSIFRDIAFEKPLIEFNGLCRWMAILFFLVGDGYNRRWATSPCFYCQTCVWHITDRHKVRTGATTSSCREIPRDIYALVVRPLLAEDINHFMCSHGGFVCP